MSASPERQAYIREYQTRTHRVSLTLSASEYRELARRAKAEGVRVTTLIKNMALAYHQGTVIQPEALTHERQELRALLRNIANNVNQMAHTSHNPAYNTLANLYYLFQNFGDDGNKLDAFMARYSVDPDNPTDRRLWNEWQGVLTGNKEGVQSFVLNAITALSAMRQANLARVTSESSFSLDSLRTEKTVIYFTTPAQHQAYYSFLTSLFFRSVFNALMRKTPPKDKRTPYLPAYVLYDEFGHSTIPDFVSTANTIRGYRVSLSCSRASRNYPPATAVTPRNPYRGAWARRLPTRGVIQRQRRTSSVSSDGLASTSTKTRPQEVDTVRQHTWSSTENRTS